MPDATVFQRGQDVLGGVGRATSRWVGGGVHTSTQGRVTSRSLGERLAGTHTGGQCLPLDQAATCPAGEVGVPGRTACGPRRKAASPCQAVADSPSLRVVFHINTAIQSKSVFEVRIFPTLSFTQRVSKKQGRGAPGPVCLSHCHACSPPAPAHVQSTLP